MVLLSAVSVLLTKHATVQTGTLQAAQNAVAARIRRPTLRQFDT
jgi:hypothetical protein